MGTTAESLRIDPEAESREPAGNSLDFGNLKVHHKGHISPNTATLLNYSQTAPPTVDQTFQYMSLQSQFSFKPHSPQMSK